MHHGKIILWGTALRGLPKSAYLCTNEKGFLRNMLFAVTQRILLLPAK
jgi:hypothetical protein